MAMEVVCGNCHGRLLVDQTGVVVACPHCGAHLQIGEPAAPSDTPSQASTTASDTWPLQVPDVPPPFAPVDMATPRVGPPLVRDQKLESVADSLPEIILTPPARSNVSVASDPPPLPSVAPELPQTVADNDSWMPKIDLAMPKAAAAEPPPRVAALDSSTMILPARHAALEAAESARAAVNRTPAKPEPTDIWSREQIEKAYPGQTPMIGTEPDFLTGPEFTPNSGPRDPLAATTLLTTLPQDPTAVQTPVQLQAPAAAEPASPGAPVLQSAASDVRSAAVVSRFWFLIIASYASAVTLALIYLLWRGAVSTIDLPDVVPQFNKNGKATWKWLRETPLPAEYQIKLGQSKRYGNIKITPLKVTRAPLEFVHFSDPKLVKAPTAAPVYKLWVKFENVSGDQTFPALDEQLLYERTNDKDNAAQVKTNNYVCQRSERKRDGKRVPVYALPINGEWLLKDQNLNSPLGPRQSWETYIPTNDEDLNDLQGPLTWRLHFRKGYNPQSFRGVTTLVEVEFDSRDIQAES